MNKKICIISNSMLLVWFFLDMFGFAVGNFVLVESAWNSIDGIWFLIFTGLLILFCAKEKYGKYPLGVFLLLWAGIQFTSHWYYTIFGASEQKIAGYNKFFERTYRIIPASKTMIIPDFYHIVLHVLILSALFCVVVYCVKNRKNVSAN